MKTVKERWQLLPRVLLLMSLLLPLFSFVQPVSADSLVINGDFSGGVSWPWVTSETWPGHAEGDVVNGEYCVTVTNPGTNRYDVQMRQRRLHIQEGHVYTATFTASAIRSTQIQALVTQGHAPYWPPHSGSSVQTFELTTAPQTFTFSFTGALVTDKATGLSMEDTAAEFAFHLGGSNFQGDGPLTICFDNISLEDAGYVAPGTSPDVPRPVRTNQHGYFVYGPKKASVLSDSATPILWGLSSGDDVLRASGQTTVYGLDAASGDYLHIIDFSDFRIPGDDYYLKVLGGARSSYHFSISDDLYGQMKYDALAYFYHNRDEEVSATYVDSTWARGAMLDENGDPYDLRTPCFSGPATDGTVWDNCVQEGTAQLFPANYRATVYGGWYDAGDHGKYVVNGGISAWTLVNMYERNLYWGDPSYAFGNGSLSIPESVLYDTPDILDEAWKEVYFMQTMQVRDASASSEVQYLVHHMIHDTAWTDVPNRPDEVVDTASNYERAVYPPSTAATLNFVAAAAQYDRNQGIVQGPDFLIQNAERAWAAALAHPDLYAVDRFNGGGPYDDDDVSDEFYWAACELYITTGKQEYLDFLRNSPHYLSVPTTLGTEGSGPMTWKNTAALGTISLATVPNDLPVSEVLQARLNIVAAADAFVANEATQGYGTPYVAGSDGYAWGSNSFILNEMVIMGLAHDFTGEMEYLDGMVSGMDYLLGRNAMDKSYVSGYGEDALQNPHHRHWAYQAWPRDDERYPAPPPGAISGGPNSTLTLEDNKATRAMGLYGTCWLTPQKCYVDDSEAFTVNEITINWNAPFAWVVAFLDENAWDFEWAHNLEQVSLSYSVRTDWNDGATVDVTITNNGDEPIETWELEWVFPGDQQIYELWNAGYTQSSTGVRVWNTESWNSVIAPNGGTVTFGFNLNYSGANVEPASFRLNGIVLGGGEGGDLTTTTTIFNDWESGYCANVTVTNNGDEAVDWETTFTMPESGTIYDFWNVNWSQGGDQVAISGVDWNNILQPGEATFDIGYCANR